MNIFRTNRLIALVATGSVTMASAMAFDADAATAPTTQPKAVIANPVASTPVISNPVATAAPAPAAATNGPPAPRIIVIDRNFILQRSSAGQEMVNQVQTLSKQAETEFKNQETQLATEANQLQQQLAILAPEAREQKEKEFTTKQQAFQTKVSTRQAEIQAGFNKAAHQLEVALEPILKTIMVERGANMVVDRSAVILSTVDIDVTPIAVQRLDKSLPHVKVELTAVPAGAAPGAVAAAPRAPAPAVLPAASPAKK